MELNEICMLMDVKLDIHDKRPESLKLKTWTKCQVKIEAIKCLPCFLRIRFQSVPQDDTEQMVQLSVSINVPGVTISFANSRFKQHSYGLFWTNNRRNCFIYFALDTEMSCRKHMKWIKKSIKNLELHRQIFLEQRRHSRGNGASSKETKQAVKKDSSAFKAALFALGPLPQIPDSRNSNDWSERASRASEIYEEIYEGSVPPCRLSRRLSRTSIASGIYEEMKPCPVNINSIVEEEINCPPPLPPFPPHRKRLNTCESFSFGSLGDIPRSNTNPETDLAKKKKYKNVFENLLVGGRSKRSESVSDTTACTFQDIINTGTSTKRIQPVYGNIATKQTRPSVKCSERNSFSSPDLSKINLLDTFDEEKLSDLLQLDTSSILDAYLDGDIDCNASTAAHNYSSLSLNDSSLAPNSSVLKMPQINRLKFGSVESLNVSAKLPQNFNFSACNTSSINLIGASIAVSSVNKFKRNEIVAEDELSGYCLMAPILSKKQNVQGTITTTTSSTTSSTTSGYSTGSFYSSTSSTSSSNTQVTENKDPLPENVASKRNATNAPTESFYDQLPLRKTPLPVAESERSNLYENLQPYSPLSASKASDERNETTRTTTSFAGNLYENLLTIKAALELEQPLPGQVCTSTPTQSPAETLSSNDPQQEEENFYKTPRKSIISVDDKIPSYYPNSSETSRVRPRSFSPAKQTTPTSLTKAGKERTSLGLKSLVNIKIKGDRKENLYMSSPQKIIEHRQKPSTNSGSSVTHASKTKKSANAQKISENIYTVNLSNKKTMELCDKGSDAKSSPCKEANESGHIKEKLQNEILQLALLQKIDFKFDDTSTTNCNETSNISPNDCTKPIHSGIAKLEQAELEYENCYQATKDATRLLHRYATMAPQQSRRIQQQLQQHLQAKEGSNQKTTMSQSTKLESPGAHSNATGSSGAMATKKFASLPRFKKIDFSPLKVKLNNVLQRNQNQDF